MSHIKNLVVMTVGGMCYGLVEIAWRGSTHISMFLVGGLCFLLIGSLDEAPDPPSLLYQAAMSSLIVTSVEFTSGVYLNIILQLKVWDYSRLPFNIMGQVCLLFSVFWFLISIPAIYFEDFLRCVLFGDRMKAIPLLPIGRRPTGDSRTVR